MKVIDKLKNVKIVWDTFSMVRKLFILLTTLGSLGGVGAGYYFSGEPEIVMEPVPLPEYALRDHTHPQPPPPVVPNPTAAISRAIRDFEEKHDPQGLGH